MPQRLHVYAKKIQMLLTGLIFIVYGGICISPFLIQGEHPLGYDTGFYMRYLANPVLSIPNTPVPGLDHTIIIPRLFLDLVRTLGLETTTSLYGSYLVLLFIFGLVFYYCVQAFTNKKIALFGLCILVISPLQYLAYWFMLYKTFFALIFFFLFFLWNKKGWHIFAFVSAVAIPLTHQSTTIVFLAVLGTFVGSTFIIKRKILLVELTTLCSTLLIYLYLHPHVEQKINTPPVGVFIERGDFILMTIPLLILTFIGLPKIITVLKEYLLLASFGFVSIVFPLFSLPYHQRIFLFTNYFLIICAAIGVHTLLEKKLFKKIVPIIAVHGILSILIFMQLFLLAYQYRLQKPLVTPKILEGLKELSAVIPNNASILTSPRLTPWAQGWSLGKVYAPGILKDKHPSWEWDLYFSSSAKDKLLFLSTFPKPLYIFIDESQKNLYIPKVACVRQLNKTLFVNECL